ncbi:hypothetical protein [Pectobacterium carotovorum]|uniref:hypothetical protein n=1 Tax=Pectobacterium carotovorum TaxID=554 RepID=UPI0005804F7F|nr:hypothetical protein [Pectobacterium carotovorum]KHT34425.1 exodeoxyribonuclease VIII-like protein [Pectobacterium carotovorum subsp. carotovorum]
MTTATFTAAFFPKKSAQKNGAIPLATAIEAKSKKLAEMAAVMLLEETFPGASDNFFKPTITEDSIGSPRPAVGTFDETFLQENELVEGVWRRIEAPTQPNDLVDFSTLSLREKIAAFALYAQSEITEHEFSMVCDYLDLPDFDGDGDTNADTDKLIRILSGIELLEQATDELLLSVVNAVNARFPSIADVADREILAFVDTLTCAPGENDTQATKPLIAGLDRERQYTHTHRTLNREVALFLANDNITDPWEVTEEQKVAGDQVMKSGGDTYSRWSTELSMVEGALKIPRPIVFILINEAKKRPELLLDANARQRFVVDFLAEHTPSEIKVESMGSGRFSIDGLMGETASNQGEKTEVVSTPEAETKQTEAVNPPAETITQQASTEAGEQIISDGTVQQAKEALDQLGYGVYATETDAPAPAPAPADDFQQRAEAIEAEIAKKPDAARGNLSIWQGVQRTNPAHTRRKETWKWVNGKQELLRAVTSVNPTYQIMRATEVFGPFGLGWGVEVTEERFDPGLPLMEPVFDSSGREINRKPMRDGDGSLVRALNHTMQIRLWYVLDGVRGEFPAFGHTKYLYAKNSGGMVCDDEVGKKSLTDAITKGLSALGFSADIYMGMFDDDEYKNKNEAEFGIKNASDKAEDVVRFRSELDEKFTRNAATMETTVSVNELNKVFGVLVREIETHRKDAEAKGDTEYAKYLSSRLRRLTEIKSEREKALKATEGEKA